MNLDKLEKLWVHELKDLYSGEKQLADALPKMAEKASDPDLKQAFRDHLEETRSHMARIESILSDTEYEPGGMRCKGMEALIAEAESALRDVPDSETEVRDAVLIAGAQRIEHYEMAGYGVARAYSQQLGRHDAAKLLTASIEEEGRADRHLTQLAERRINFEAMNA